MKKFKLVLMRISTFPNQYGSYAYLVVDASGLDAHEINLDDIGGKRETDDGVVIFSSTLAGKVNENATINCVLRSRNGVDYINIIDNSNEALVKAGDITKKAERFG